MKYELIKINRKGYLYPFPEKKLYNYINNNLHYVKKGSQFMPNPEWGQVYFCKKAYIIIDENEEIRKVTNNIKIANNFTRLDVNYKLREVLSFPAGFFNKVLNILNNENQEVSLIKDVTLQRKEVFELNPKFRYYQKDAFLSLVKNEGGFISIPTRGGKTFIMLEFIRYVDKKTLVIVHTIDLKSQWNRVINKETTEVITYQKFNRYKGLELFKFLKEYGLIIFDEAHHIAASKLYNIAKYSGNAFLAGCSATPYRDDGEDMRIEAALGGIVYSIKIRELIDNGYLCDANIKYIKLMRSGNEIIDYPDSYKKYIVYNKERNEKIVKIASKSKKPTLILISITNHGKLLYERLKELRNDVCFIHGKLSKKIRKQMFEEIVEGKYGVVIASSIFDEGIDLPEFKILILAVGGKSSVQIVQRFGRILTINDNKDNALVYDFMDDCKFLKKHYIIRRNILNQNFKIEEVSL